MSHCVILMMVALALLLVRVKGDTPDERTDFLHSILTHAEVEVFTNTTYSVWHMESDLYRPGSILYTDLGSMKTSNGTSSETIAGSTAHGGYKEAVGRQARFELIRGFTQLSETRVVVTDVYNHCVRIIERLTRATSVLVGQCRTDGYQDGRSAKFNLPWSIIQDTKNANQLYLTDDINKAVRVVSIDSKYTETLVKSNLLNSLQGIEQESESGDILISNNNMVYLIPYDTKRLVQLVGSTLGGFVNGDYASSLFNSPEALVQVASYAFLVPDKNNWKIRLIDMEQETVSTLQVCTTARDSSANTADTCEIPSPFSVLVVNSTLLIGTYRQILIANFANTRKPTVQTDGRLRRRLVFRAEYNLTCTVMSDSVISSVIRAMSEKNYQLIEDICSDDCRRQNNDEPRMICLNQTLTVEWETNLTFSGNVTQIPPTLRAKLDSRLVAKGSSLSILLLDPNPRVVYPRVTASRASATVELRGYCAGGFNYDRSKETCE